MEVDNGVVNNSDTLPNGENETLYDQVEKKTKISQENENLKCIIEQLEKEIAILKADRSQELHTIQLETLEKTISEQRIELESLQTASLRQAEQSQKQLDQLKNEFGLRIEKVSFCFDFLLFNDFGLKLTKQYEQASKDKEAMVMKYAVSENNAITLQNQMKQLENKIRDYLKDKESLEGKIGNVVNEKGKLLQVIDSKVFKNSSFNSNDSK